jgi:hypothetical protein
VFEVFPEGELIEERSFSHWFFELRQRAAKVSTREIEKGRSKLSKDMRYILFDVLDEYEDQDEMSLMGDDYAQSFGSFEGLCVGLQEKRSLSRKQQAAHSRSLGRLVDRGLLLKRAADGYMLLSFTPLGYAVARWLEKRLTGVAS